jgi:hypothetical protein
VKRADAFNGCPTVRRHPRTLQEAFGPHVSRELHTPREGATLAEKVMAVLAAAVLGGWALHAVLALLAGGGL